MEQYIGNYWKGAGYGDVCGLILFKDEDITIFWKMRLRIYKNRKPADLSIKSISKVIKTEKGYKLWSNAINTVVRKENYMKLRSGVIEMVSYGKRLNRFLYDKIQLDEMGLCNIITDFAKI